MMSVFLEDRFAGEGAETLRVDCVERHANDPALRNEAGANQVKEAGQQLLVGEIPGRAKQDDDLRQLGADPAGIFAIVIPTLALDSALDRAPLSRVRTTETRQSKTTAGPDFTAVV